MVICITKQLFILFIKATNLIKDIDKTSGTSIQHTEDFMMIRDTFYQPVAACAYYSRRQFGGKLINHARQVVGFSSLPALQQ